MIFFVKILKEFYSLIVEKNNQKTQYYKIGRTFNSLSRRYSWNFDPEDVIKLWYSNHTVIFSLEEDVLHQFQKYDVFSLKKHRVKNKILFYF